jgi:hypothetical protein
MLDLKFLLIKNGINFDKEEAYERLFKELEDKESIIVLRD